MDIKINSKVKKFQEDTNFLGWYYDVNGNYCGIVGTYLFCVFVNSDTDELELTISYSWDIYECNTIEWITIEDVPLAQVNHFIRNFINENYR